MSGTRGVHAEGAGEEAVIVQDVMRGWSRIGDHLQAVVREIATILARYGVARVLGDRYAAGWVRGAFQEAGVIYDEPRGDTSQTFLEIEPYLAQGRVRLLDHPQLARELQLLERRPQAGGKTVVTHPRGGHDDHAAAWARAALGPIDSLSVLSDAPVIVGPSRGEAAVAWAARVDPAGRPPGW